MDLATTPVAGSPLFDGALCANMRCLKDAATAQLTVQLQLQNTFGSDEWTTCDNDNTNSTNVNFVTVRYNSSTTVMIACPPAWEVCGSLPTNITAAPPPTTTMAPATTCAYTCPDGNCATDMASCACLADNNLFVVQTLVQLNAPAASRGRVIGLYAMVALGLRAFAGVTVGLGGSLVGIHWSLALSALALLLVSAFLFMTQDGARHS